MSDVFPRAAQAAMLAVLHAAHHRHYKVTRMKLAKLLYLCDLEAVRSGRSQFTGITWKWLHYGPFNNGLLSLEDELVAAGAIERSSSRDFYGNVENRLRPVADFAPLDPAQWAILVDVVDRYGKLAPSSLKDVTYQTEPMVAAQEAGQRGVVLDLSLVRPLPEIAPALRALRKVRDRLEPGFTDPDVWDDLREENRALGLARRAATTGLLDE